ncbi:MAG TPA: hypothetical protein DCX53_12195 [Anaerolineae bacterium]|nr:hypothetical protein [Anaerolineae bacterium]
MLDRSVKHNEFCAIGGQFHVDPFQLGGDPAEKAAIFLEGTLDYANELGVPIVSSQDWLYFTEDRDGSNFVDVTWDEDASLLTFSLLPRHHAISNLTILVPTHHAGTTLSSLSINGVTTSSSTRLVLGNVEYAQLLVEAREQSIRATYS